MSPTECQHQIISAFAPISQIRFWGAQVICVATPSAFFVVYSIQRKNKVILQKWPIFDVRDVILI